LHGLDVLNEGARSISETVKVIAGTRNVMGVATPVLEILKAPGSTLALPIEVCELQAKRRELLETFVAIAEYEKELIRLGVEIARVKRIVTMLEKILIPRLLNTIRYLMMKFDEMEREDKVRSMKIKALLAQRA
jgi:Archaeal/vacuolar-type H+-ATPase subunit D